MNLKAPLQQKFRYPQLRSPLANFLLATANFSAYGQLNAQVTDTCHRLIGSLIEEVSTSTHFGAWRSFVRDALRDDDPMS